MKRKIFFRGFFLLIILLILLGVGCAGKKKEIKTIEGDPEILYKRALAQFNKREYSEALKLFEQIKASFPDSPPYTIWAELKIADCYFLKKEYVEAIAAYEEFKKFHPTHEEIPYVLYQIGLSHFNQMRTLDRDQTSTKRALSNFEYLIASYPPSLFTEKASEKVGICKKRLFDHEFYIGNFYYKKGKYQAAASRFEGLLEKFPKNPEEDKALYFLGKSYIELEKEEKAIEAFSRILKEYPKSLYYKEARSIVDHGVKSKKATEKTKLKEAKKERAEPETIVMVRFEEERKQPLSLEEEKRVEFKEKEKRVASLPVVSESVKPIPPKEEKSQEKLSIPEEPFQEGRIPSLPPQAHPKLETAPEEEKRVALPPPPLTSPQAPSPSIVAKPEVELKPEDEKRVAALPSTSSPLEEKGKPKKEILSELKKTKTVETGQPIDIVSDSVETYSKENLIIFKGNVMARQKDIIIYADSIEAVIVEDGKGIEKVIAGGNVKIQQGVRVASCQKAIFYNLDQKVVLTGNPKIWEGDNVVSGDEIIFDIEKSRFEVKGGSGQRGKARIYPGEEMEKLK